MVTKRCDDSSVFVKRDVDMDALERRCLCGLNDDRDLMDSLSI